MFGTPLRSLSPAARAVRADDRGEVASNTIAAAAVLGLFFLVVQIGLWFNAQAVAEGAANNALDASRVENGTAADGIATAEQFLGQVGSLQDAQVEVDRGAETVVVTVTGSAWSPQPFFDPPITVRMTAPVERVVG